MKPGEPDVKTAVNRGLAWVGAASSLVWLLDVLGMVIILAFWISPEEMGVAAVAITLFPVLDLVCELGLSWAVIQRDDHTDERLSTVFWVNFGAGAVLAALLVFAIGPLLASIHGQEIVRWLLAAHGGKLLFQNTYIIPNAMVKRQLRFKEISVVRTLANVAEFAGKVGFAAGGFGIWCFVLGPYCRVFVQGVGYQILFPWRPKLVFRFRETFEWIKFGLKASGSNLIYHLYSNVDYQVVGYVFGEYANGLYWFAYELVLKPCYQIAHTLQNVAFPAYSRLQREREKLVEQFLSFTRLSLIVMTAFLTVVLVSADDILWLVWGDAGAVAAPAARILCFVGVLRAMSFVIPPLLAGVGRPGLSLTYNIIAAISLTGMFFAFAYLLGPYVGYLSVAWAWVAGYPIAFGALLLMALVILELPVLTYLRRAAGIPLCAAVAVGAGFGLREIATGWTPGLRLAVVAVVVLGVFFGLLAQFQGVSPRSVMRAMKAKDGS